MALRDISLSLYVSLAVDETTQASALPMQVRSNHFLDWWNGSKYTFALTRVHVLFRKEAFWCSVSVSIVQTETCVFLFQPQTQRILQNMRSPRKKASPPRWIILFYLLHYEPWPLPCMIRWGPGSWKQRLLSGKCILQLYISPTCFFFFICL